MKKVSVFWNDKNESLSKLKGLVMSLSQGSSY
jgi:hypothetical protein